MPGACGGSAPRPCAPDGDPSPLRRGAVLQTSPLCCRALIFATLVLWTVGCRPDAVDGPNPKTPSALVAGSSSSTNSLHSARWAHVAVRLGDGRVLVAGGVNGSTLVASAELFDPASGTWTTTGSMAVSRLGHAAVLLADGRVLVVGGVSNYTCAAEPVGTSAEIYDPATGLWSPTGSMQVARSSAAIALLADGNVLVAGGGNRCSRVWNSAELYDPATGEWTLTDGMSAARQSAAAVRLTDGRVLVAGGIGASPFASLATAELYDPANGTWAATGSMRNRRYWTFEDMAALDNFLSLLPDGRVFTAGGVDRCGALFCARNILNAAELYDPASGTWTPTGAMAGRRAEHQTTVLAGGRVLVSGGQYGGAALNTVELYDVASGTFATAAPLATARFDHTTTLLADGRALIAGGRSTTSLSAAEIYALNTNLAPVAVAGPPVTGTEGAAVAFGGSGSADPDGDALSYLWDFGDGSPTATGAQVSHVYADNGTYTITLTVSDGTLTGSASTTATIANVAPVVSSLGGGTLLPGETYNGSGYFTDPGADVWSATVDYGDGSGLEPLS
ncbi:MAG: PKD domain-containing protein, partial [Deltaproteobacteria bacterium]